MEVDVLSKVGLSLRPGFMFFEKFFVGKGCGMRLLSFNSHLCCSVLVSFLADIFLGGDPCELPRFSAFLHFFCGGSIMWTTELIYMI